jgi:pimeloyl-ACP methyl ester carboxylesterase
MGCDGGLYADILPRLSAVVEPLAIVADKDTLAGCVQQVLERAPESFIILGTSFGGRTALEVAIAAPQRVKGLVVIGAGPGVAADPAAGVKRTERLRGTEFGGVVTEMADMVSHLPGPNGTKARNAFISMSHKLGGALMARQSAALSKRADLWPKLGEITCPSLMLWGREDKFSPAADGLKMSTCLPHGRYAEISVCGHFPSLEAPKETADIILHWLQDSRFI